MDKEPTDKIVHLILNKEANQVRLDWENKKPALESAVRQAKQALRTWKQQVNHGATEEAAIRESVKDNASVSKEVLKSDRIRVNDQKDYRKFLELEKTLESKLDGPKKRLAQNEQRDLAISIGKNKTRGLFSDRTKAAVVKAGRTQDRSRGGLEH